jgi:hypothetical protein
MKLRILIASLVLAGTASAETLYTRLEDTVVRDKPMALGSTVVAHLKAGTMLETIKQIGAFSTVSYIQNGKVKTGFVQTSQLKGEEKKAVGIGAVEAAQTTDLGDPSSMIMGLGEDKRVASVNSAVSDPMAAARSQVPAGLEDPSALLTSKLDSLLVPAKDLATFASNGKLVSRRPKGK